LQLRSKTESLIKAVTGGKTVSEGQDERSLHWRASAHQGDRQKGGGNRPADHGVKGGAIVTCPQAP